MEPQRAGAQDLDAIVALQQAAYAENQALLGAVPLPLQADYTQILRDMEAWVVADEVGLAGVLVLELRPDDLLIWSVATHPRARSAGVGRTLLRYAERRAREGKRAAIRLYTASVYTRNIAWYARNGFVEESRETYPDRIRVNMIKNIE